MCVQFQCMGEPEVMVRDLLKEIQLHLVDLLNGERVVRSNLSIFLERLNCRNPIISLL